MNEARGLRGVLLAVACIVLTGCIGRMGSSQSPSQLAEASVMPSSPPPSPIATSQATPTPDPSDAFNIAAMPGTAGPGCGTGQKGFFTHRDEIQHTLTLDGAPIELTTATVGLRNGSYDADDAIPGYLGLSSDELAVKEEPAGKLVLAAKAMDLTKLTVGAVPWSTVDFSLDLPFTTATPAPVAWKLLTNGTIAITAPSKAGDYLLDMTVLWETECLHGDGTVYGRVLVR
ncbi:MAG TPA: hypothetical protein VFY18_06095 [Candidatus Limnocylindrales bacterium]|nr:hypothetical protein [Candidatus Limnocylindrales bacterium]